MAESLADKLKRLAAEKKAAKEAVAVVESAVTEAVASVANDQPVMAVAVAVAVAQAGEDGNGQSDSSQSCAASDTDSNASLHTEPQGEAVHQILVDPMDVETSVPSADSNILELETNSVVPATIQPTPSNHPLAMQFAEMESALLTADPKFKLILRDVHRTLGKDPELVTQMTEEEISLVVRGLVVFANAEIVEPAKAKAVKAGQAAMKKKAISADDL